MRRISEREWRDDPDTVLNAVAAGATYQIIRNGVEVTEIGPGSGSRGLTAEELVALRWRLPRIGYADMRRDADEFFGTEGRIGTDDDPWERLRRWLLARYGISRGSGTGSGTSR